MRVAGARPGQYLGTSRASPAPPRLLVAGLILAVVVAHLAVTNLAACVALLWPISATIAAGAGFNPIVIGLILTITVDAVILYPVQTAGARHQCGQRQRGADGQDEAPGQALLEWLPRQNADSKGARTAPEAG